SVISCDRNTSATHICIEYSCLDNPISEIEQACQTLGGSTASLSCTPSGSTGSCLLGSSNAGQSVLASSDRSFWLYALAAPDAMAICTQLNGTFVAAQGL